MNFPLFIYEFVQITYFDSSFQSIPSRGLCTLDWLDSQQPSPQTSSSRPRRFGSGGGWGWLCVLVRAFVGGRGFAFAFCVADRVQGPQGWGWRGGVVVRESGVTFCKPIGSDALRSAPRLGQGPGASTCSPSPPSIYPKAPSASPLPSHPGWGLRRRGWVGGGWHDVYCSLSLPQMYVTKTRF